MNGDFLKFSLVVLLMMIVAIFFLLINFEHQEITTHQVILGKKIYSVQIKTRGHLTTLCSFDKNELMFCIVYKDLPENIKHCMLYNSPIIYYNFTSYKYCGNERVLNMKNLEINKLNSLNDLIVEELSSHNYGNEDMNYNLNENVSNFKVVYQRDLKTCPYFSLLNIILNYYNDSQSANYIRKIIYDNRNKVGVGIEELCNLVKKNNYTCSKSFIDHNNTKNIFTLINANSPAIILMKYNEYGYRHTRVIVGHDNKTDLIHILDSASLYGFNPKGEMFFSRRFFERLLNNETYIISISRKS